MMNVMTTRRDLRNWVDAATSDWFERTETDIDTITNTIQADDHPSWGTDWTDYLATLQLDVLTN